MAGTVAVNGGYGVHAEVGYAGVRPVVVSGGRSPAIAVTSWSGAGSVHDPATWTGPFRVGKSNSFALASGRRGLWLAHEISAGYPDRMVVRKFSGNRFGRAHRIPAGRRGLTPVAGAALAQDAAGRMVAVWYSSTGERLEYSKSRTGALVAGPGADDRRRDAGRPSGRPRPGRPRARRVGREHRPERQRGSDQRAMSVFVNAHFS